MRTFVAATLAAVMIATSALAAANVSPVVPAKSLTPGKPAGVKKAQGEDDTVFWVLGLGAVGAGIGLVASGNSNNVVTTNSK